MDQNQIRAAWLRKISKVIASIKVDGLPNGEFQRLSLDPGDPDLAIDNKHLLYVNRAPVGQITKWEYIKSTQLSGTLENLITWLQDSQRRQYMIELSGFEIDDIQHFNSKFVYTEQIGEGQTVHFLNYPYLLTEAPLRDIERVLAALTNLQNDRIKKAAEPKGEGRTEDQIGRTDLARIGD